MQREVEKGEREKEIGSYGLKDISFSLQRIRGKMGSFGALVLAVIFGGLDGNSFLFVSVLCRLC